MTMRPSPFCGTTRKRASGARVQGEREPLPPPPPPPPPPPGTSQERTAPSQVLPNRGRADGRAGADGAELHAGHAGVFEDDYLLGTGGGRTYDVAQDGQRFLIIKEGGGDDDTSAQPQIIVVLNWHEELKRLVPVD